MGSPETWPVCICGHSRTRHARRVMPGCVSVYGECVGFGPDFKRCECPTYCHDGATPPAPADDVPGDVFVYRPASWRGQDPHDGKRGRDDVKWVCRRADATPARPTTAADAVVEAARALDRAAEWFDDAGATAVHGGPEHDEGCVPCEAIIEIRRARRALAAALAATSRASATPRVRGANGGE